MAIINRFIRNATTPVDESSPSLAHFNGDTVKSDTVDLAEVCRKIYVGGAGNVKFTDTSGFTGTFIGMPVGSTVTGFFTRVWATGTTATNIIIGV